MIVVTGAAGFIGSCLIGALNARGIEELILVDDFSSAGKNKNYEGKKFGIEIDRGEFLTWFDSHKHEVDFVYHIGARTDTTEPSKAVFDELNLNYSKEVWRICTDDQIPLVYASSAATYGNGENGYDDRHDIVDALVPLNEYGISKNEFDRWALKQEGTPPFWAGMKFFNVYGPNEYHKGRMASVIFHTYNQIQETGKMKLFRSHNENYADGEQLRDFVYVKDVIAVLQFMKTNMPESGLYNLGTGTARTFLDLAKNTFKALGKEPHVDFIDTPADIRDKYQYFTEANMEKLIKAGYDVPFYTLEEGVDDYVTNYLASGTYF